MDDDSLRADLHALSLSRPGPGGTGAPEDVFIAPPQKALEHFLGISLDPEFYQSLMGKKDAGEAKEQIQSSAGELLGASSQVEAAGEPSEVPPPQTHQAPLVAEPVEPPPPAEEPFAGIDASETIPDPSPHKPTARPPLSPGSPGVETCLVYESKDGSIMQSCVVHFP